MAHQATAVPRVHHINNSASSSGRGGGDANAIDAARDGLPPGWPEKMRSADPRILGGMGVWILRLLLLSVVATNLISSGSLQHAAPGPTFRGSQGLASGRRRSAEGRGSSLPEVASSSSSCTSRMGSGRVGISWDKLGRLRGGGSEDADDDDDHEMSLDGRVGEDGGASAEAGEGEGDGKGEGGGLEGYDHLELVERGGPLRKGAWTEEDEVEGELAPITELIRDPSKRPPNRRWKGALLERVPQGPWDVGNSKLHDIWDEDSTMSETDPDDPDEHVLSDSSEPNIDWDEKVTCQSPPLHALPSLGALANLDYTSPKS